MRDLQKDIQKKNFQRRHKNCLKIKYVKIDDFSFNIYSSKKINA
jgi:hypothetical protein